MQPRGKLGIVATVLVVCAISIAWSVWRHRNAPFVDVSFMFPETREHVAKRLADENVRQNAWLMRTLARMKADHKVSLQGLTDIEQLQGVDWCDRKRRQEFRSSVHVYAVRRVNAYRNAPNEGLVDDVAATWETLADSEAVAVAVDRMNRGYVLPSDFQSWTADYPTIYQIFHAQVDALPACAERLD